MSLEEDLAELLYGARASFPGLDPDEVAEARASVHKMVRERNHRGTGSVREWYPRTIANQDLDALTERFCRSQACGEWREHAESISLEEAWHRFFEAESVGDPLAREDEFLGAVVRALAVTPRARFLRPAKVNAAPGGCFAITSSGVLHAALDGRYLRGEVTPLIRELLGGRAARSDDETRLLQQLRAMRLV